MLKYLVQPILYHLSNLKNDICVFSFHSISIVCSLIHLLQLRTHKPDKPLLFLNLSTIASLPLSQTHLSLPWTIRADTLNSCHWGDFENLIRFFPSGSVFLLMLLRAWEGGPTLSMLYGVTLAAVILVGNTPLQFTTVLFWVIIATSKVETIRPV